MYHIVNVASHQIRYTVLPTTTLPAHVADTRGEHDKGPTNTPNLHNDNINNNARWLNRF